MAYKFNTESGNKNGDFIKVNNVDFESYSAFYASDQRYLPKSADVHLCGMEMDEEGNLGRSFTLYRTKKKTGSKTYIVFHNYFEDKN